MRGSGGESNAASDQQQDPIGHRNQPDLPESVKPPNAAIRPPGSRAGLAERQASKQHHGRDDDRDREHRADQQDGARLGQATGSARRAQQRRERRRARSLTEPSRSGRDAGAGCARRCRRSRSRRALGAIDRDRNRAARRNVDSPRSAAAAHSAARSPRRAAESRARAAPRPTRSGTAVAQEIGGVGAVDHAGLGAEQKHQARLLVARGHDRAGLQRSRAGCAPAPRSETPSSATE